MQGWIMQIFNFLNHWIIIFNLLFALAIIFLERRNIGVTWAWLMLLLFLPFIGFVIYILLGQNLARRKVYKLKPRMEQLVREEITAQMRAIKQGEWTYCNMEAAHYEQLIYMNLAYSASPLTQNNEVAIITDGHEKMDALVQQIHAASHHVHLLYYKLGGDETGNRIIQALTAKAEEGLMVRLLYDDIGSLGVNEEAIKQLRAAGGEVYRFFPSKIPYFNLRVNYRNHRKIAVMDGKIGFVGGFNIGNEYLGKDPAIGYWRDTHLMIRGDAVQRLQGQFMMDWSVAAQQHIAMTADYFPAMEKIGNTAVQIVASGPDNEFQQIKNGLIKLIFEAKERLYVQTPYFVPDESVLTALKLAVRSGVDVRVMIPRKGDSRLVQWASNAYLGELVRTGAKCYLYEKGFLHAKTIVVDGKAASVGTANLDHRSFGLNFEVNAFLYDEGVATQLERIFEQDIAFSHLLTRREYMDRGLANRFVESVARLVSPIL